MQAQILWIKSKRVGDSSYIPSLRKKGCSIETVPTGKAALEQLPKMGPDIVVIDAISLRSSGRRICQSIRSAFESLPILLIENPDHRVPDDLSANVILRQPFTIRKLVNRIKPLLPGKSDHVVEIGPICLDLERKRVQSEDREAKLTPRLTLLLKTLMKKHGEVLEREWLFREVWNTEYTGDTRTLDVHISWLRSAIEEDPSNPELLKTIRGVGYRLDI